MNELSYARLFDTLLGQFDQDFPLIQEAIRLSPIAPVVELGAGSGRILRGNTSRREVYLVEKDPDMHELLARKVAGRSDVVALARDAVATDLPDKWAGTVIFAANSLAEIQPAVFALAEAIRILRDDGLIHVVLANPANLGRQPQGVKPGPRGAAEPYSYLYDLRPDPARGKHGFIMHLRARNGRYERSFEIRQTLLPFADWLEIFAILGVAPLSVFGDFSGGEFQEKTSQVMIFNLKKKDASLAPKQPLLQKKFDEMAPGYDDSMVVAKYAAPEWVRQNSLRYKDCHINVLDLGCGTGMVGRTFVDLGVQARVFGIDFSGEMVATCRKSTAYTSVLQADLSQGIPVAEHMYFDLITAIGVLEFVHDLGEILRKVRDLLIVGGEVWLTVEHSSLPGRQVNDTVPGFTKYSYSPTLILEMCEQAELLVTGIEEGFGHRSFAYAIDIKYIFLKAKRIK